MRASVRHPPVWPGRTAHTRRRALMWVGRPVLPLRLGRPLALASALTKLDRAAHRIPMQVAPAVAPLAQVNPLSALNGRGVLSLFSTHPSTEERVARLQALAA